MWRYVVLLGSGLVAGFINAVAGSGSLLTLPALMLVGLPPSVANGTNRLGIISQGLAAVIGYRRAGVRLPLRPLRLLIPSLLGVLVGSHIAVSLDEEVIRLAITIVLLLMAGLMFVRPAHWARATEYPERLEHPKWIWGLMLLIGLYVGFVQVGSGFLILFALVLVGGMDLLHGNILKNLFQFVFQLTALPVYLLGGGVDWGAGLTLSVGMAVGAWFGSRCAVKRGARFLRLILILAVGAFVLFQLRGWLGNF